MWKTFSIYSALLLAASTAWADDTCVSCHTQETPRIVTDWKNSAHFGAEVSCDACHGDGHMSAADVANVETVTADSCGACHETQLGQFSKGKHAVAWAAYEAMPTTHALPMALGQGMKGCGGCHKVGLKDAEREVEAGGIGVRSRVLRRLSHPAHLLGGRGAAAAGVPDLSHGL
jgi:hypothetical protein